MPLKADFQPRFLKELRSLPDKDQKTINEAINNFLSKNGTFDVVRLEEDLWRLKIGPWRIFFDFVGDLIVFLYIKRRTSKTYK